MTKIERENNKAAIERFVQGVEEGITKETARKYGNHLLALTEAFAAPIDVLARDSGTRDYVIEHMDDYLHLSHSVKNEYKSGFNKYCKFISRIEKSAARSVMDSSTKPYSLIRVDKFDEFQRLFLSKEKFNFWREDGDKFIFRGQGDATWPLETSLGREQHTLNMMNPRGDFFKDCENEAMWLFGREASKNLEYRGLEGANLLSLMQHYGCKTRLLDFTQSPLIALYMAVEQFEGLNIADDGKRPDIALWTVNVSRLFCHCNKVPLNQVAKAHLHECNSILSLDHDRKIPGVSIVYPSICNWRISAQDALFLMPHSLSWSFEDNLRAVVPDDNLFEEKTLSSYDDLRLLLSSPVCKLVIGGDLHKKLKSMLKDANINARTVYPDLVGLGRYIGKSIQERLRR